MKSNKDENEPLKIEFKAKMKKIKVINCIIFLHWQLQNILEQKIFKNQNTLRILIRFFILEV